MKSKGFIFPWSCMSRYVLEANVQIVDNTKKVRFATGAVGSCEHADFNGAVQITIFFLLFRAAVLVLRVYSLSPGTSSLISVRTIVSNTLESDQ